jgi:hypothetical protein
MISPMEVGGGRVLLLGFVEGRYGRYVNIA